MTNDAGEFLFLDLMDGEDQLLLKSALIQPRAITVLIDGNTALGDITIKPLEINQEINNALVGLISEEFVEDDFETTKGDKQI